MKKITKEEKALKEIAENSENELEKDVALYWLDEVANYNGNVEGWIKDLLNHGCVSGMVGKLIYYVDTHAYYDKHYDNIEELITELEENTGENVCDWNKDKSDRKNFLAWLGFEEMARKIADKIGVEV